MNGNVAARAFGACLVVAAALVAWRLAEVLAILLGAIVVASAIAPIANRISGRRLSPRTALGIAYAGLLTGVAAVGVLIGRALVSELGVLGREMATSYASWRQRGQAGSFVLRLLTDHLPRQLGEAPTELLSGASFTSTTAPLHVLNSVAWTLVLAICWSFAGERIEQVAFALVGSRWRPRARAAWRAMHDHAGAVLRDEVTESLVLMVVLSGVFYFGEVRYAVVAALLVAILRLLPFVGGPIAVLVSALAGMSVGPWHGALTGTLSALLLIGSARLTRDTSDAHPLLVAVVALAILIGHGGIAVVVAPVLAAAMQGLAGGWIERRAERRVEGAARVAAVS